MLRCFEVWDVVAGRLLLMSCGKQRPCLDDVSGTVLFLYGQCVNLSVDCRGSCQFSHRGVLPPLLLPLPSFRRVLEAVAMCNHHPPLLDKSTPKSVSRASLAVHKSHMLSDDTSSQRAARKSLAQGRQPAAPAMWCTATPSQQSTAAASIILHPWALRPPPQCAHP